MAASFFSAVTAFVAAHPHLAYLAVLLLALSESIPVVGAVVPGTAIILAVSALVPSGIVTLWPLLGAAFAGAVIGDGVSFWLGHRHHRAILGRWPLSRYPDLVARSEDFFARHGDKSIFIARFTPGVRAFVPLVAGMLRMPVRRFYVANVLSALVWAPSHILPAVFVGAAFGMFGAAAKPLAILAVLIVVVLWAATRLVRLVLRRGPPLAARMSERMRARDSRWGRLALALLDPARSDARNLALPALLLIGSAWLFFGILEDVASGDPLVRMDMAIYRALQELRTEPGDGLMLVVTELGDTAVVVAVTLAVLAWLAWKRCWRTAFYWLVAIAGASALNTAIKVTLHRARPSELFYTGWSTFSFPSGHSTVNLVLYGFLTFLIGRELRPMLRLPVAFAALSLALLIAMSRLYLGAHWFSDVVGGLAFGAGWLAILVFFHLRKESRPVGALDLSLVACLALGLAGGWDVARHHALDMQRYARKAEVAAMTADDWRAGGWSRLAARRIDLTGEIEEPLIVQWAGDLAAIERRLSAQGWRAPAPWLSPHALAWLTADPAPRDLPVAIRTAGGRWPALTLVQDQAAPERSRLVLRLWPADIQLAGGEGAPLWIGSVVEERLGRHFSLVTSAWVGADMNAGRDALAREFPEGELVARPDGAGDGDWDGRVLLLRTP